MQLNSITKNIASWLSLAALLFFPFGLSAQNYEEQNGSELSTEIYEDVAPDVNLNGHYQGYVDAGFEFGVTKYRADILSIATSQGYRFNPWFYMGAGTGLDFLFSHKSSTWGQGWENAPGFNVNHPSTKTAVMLPLFGDFRFLIGNPGKRCSFFLDLRVGASFLLSNKYIAIKDGFITDKTFFYLDPSVGINIPVCQAHPERAIDIAINYRLLTSSYWNRRANNITLQLVGINIGYEW